MPEQAPEVKYEANGLLSMREERPSTVQPAPHSHNEIEMLLIERGQGQWMLSGDLLTLKAGSLAVFWSVRPHQLLKSSRNLVLHWLTLPLTVFVEWRLPGAFTKALFAGGVFVEPDKSLFTFDRHAFEQWHQDLRSPDRERQRLALLEIEARLRRLALGFPDGKGAGVLDLDGGGTFNHHYFEKVSEIADFVSKNFSQALPVVDIARHINMHPASATKLFKKICGMSLMRYVTQHRIFHAQRLLLSTDMKIVDVALDSGYQSASRFYAAFKEFCGQSPQEYRHFVRRRGGQEPQ
jgi:AraC family transcriptional regulator, melibiose operon regulatory protein